MFQQVATTGKEREGLLLLFPTMAELVYISAKLDLVVRPSTPALIKYVRTLHLPHGFFATIYNIPNNHSIQGESIE